MDEKQPTTLQLVLFIVVLSFIVSIIGTVLALGVFTPVFGIGDGIGTPFIFQRPKILDKIIGKSDVDKAIEENNASRDNVIVKVVEDSSPAVVSIVASKDVPVVEQFFVDPFGGDPFFKQFFGDGGSGVQVPQYRQKGTEKQEVSAGTGFLVSADGLILTNKHVVQDTEAEYTVFLNKGKKYIAKVLARDPFQDLAIIKINAPAGVNFPTVKLGDSSQVKIGQTTIAIGNALGEFRNTVSVGVISGLGRSVVAQGSQAGPETLQELMQTDAAINPGNSGGPILNIHGEVIGINTAMAQGAQNIGFAIPINKAKRDLTNITQHGKIIYPFLGIRYVIVTSDLVDKQKLGRDYGALITKSDSEPAVVPDSPAAKAGIKEGDIILEINHERIDQDHTLSSLIQKYQVGDEITLKNFRDNKEFEVKVKLEERK